MRVSHKNIIHITHWNGGPQNRQLLHMRSVLFDKRIGAYELVFEALSLCSTSGISWFQHHLCHSKVSDLGMLMLIHEYVHALYISMKHLSHMHVVQRAEDLHCTSIEYSQSSND